MPESIGKRFHGHRGRSAYLNSAIDPNGIPLAESLKVDGWRQIIKFALCYLYAG
jgi:hypothetical protein